MDGPRAYRRGVRAFTRGIVTADFLLAFAAGGFDDVEIGAAAGGNELLHLFYGDAVRHVMRFSRLVVNDEVMQWHEF